MDLLAARRCGEAWIIRRTGGGSSVCDGKHSLRPDSFGAELAEVARCRRSWLILALWVCNEDLDQSCETTNKYSDWLETVDGGLGGERDIQARTTAVVEPTLQQLDDGRPTSKARLQHLTLE